MTAHVSSRVRQQVRRRAEGKCEYCLVHEEDGYVGYQTDHIPPPFPGSISKTIVLPDPS